MSEEDVAKIMEANKLENRTVGATAEKRFRASNEALSRDQVRKLLEGCTNPREQLMLKMGVYTGCRVNELVHLKLEKVDYAQDCITVWDDKKSHWAWKRNATTGKMERERKLDEGRWRKIAIPKALMVELKAWIEANPTGTDQVWNLSWVTWNRAIKKWSMQLLGINKSWHVLRHTFVSLHSGAGTPLSFVKQQTGDTANTLLKVYDNPSPDMIREQAEKRLF